MLSEIDVFFAIGGQQRAEDAMCCAMVPAQEGA